MAVLQVYVEFYAKGWTITDSVLKEIFYWPLKPAETKQEMMKLEDIHESLRLYLWLRYMLKLRIQYPFRITKFINQTTIAAQYHRTHCLYLL